MLHNWPTGAGCRIWHMHVCVSKDVSFESVYVTTCTTRNSWPKSIKTKTRFICFVCVFLYLFSDLGDYTFPVLLFLFWLIAYCSLISFRLSIDKFSISGGVLQNLITGYDSKNRRMKALLKMTNFQRCHFQLAYRRVFCHTCLTNETSISSKQTILDLLFGWNRIEPKERFGKSVRSTPSSSKYLNFLNIFKHLDLAHFIGLLV